MRIILIIAKLHQKPTKYLFVAFDGKNEAVEGLCVRLWVTFSKVKRNQSITGRTEWLLAMHFFFRLPHQPIRWKRFKYPEQYHVIRSQTKRRNEIFSNSWPLRTVHSAINKISSSFIGTSASLRTISWLNIISDSWPNVPNLLFKKPLNYFSTGLIIGWPLMDALYRWLTRWWWMRKEIACIARSSWLIRTTSTMTYWLVWLTGTALNSDACQLIDSTAEWCLLPLNQSPIDLSTSDRLSSWCQLYKSFSSLSPLISSGIIAGQCGWICV